MNAAEKLEKAKKGDEYAYRQLCGDMADGLYAAAMLTLNRSEDAEKAVLGAINDGYASISRIKDEEHLRAWLSRELTKHLVARIKEYKAQGITLAPIDEFSRLPSLDRIVCALRFTFGYNEREIARITGLNEDTVTRKLEESRRKLGNHKSELLDRMDSYRAPASLRAPEKPRPAEEAPLIKERPQALKPEPPKKPEPRETQEKQEKHEHADIDARTFIGVITAQKIKGKDFLQLLGNTRISNSAYHEIEQNPDLTKERLVELLESSPLTSEDYYKLLTAVKQRGELISRKEKVDRIKEEAGLFILEQKAAGKLSGSTGQFRPVEKPKPQEPEKKQPAAEKPEPKPVERYKPPVSARSVERAFEKAVDRLSETGEIPKPPEKPVGATGPFQPILNTAVLDDLSGSEDLLSELPDIDDFGDLDEPAEIEEKPSPKSAPKPEPELRQKPRPARPVPIILPDDADADEEDFRLSDDEPAGRRGRYKGEDQFINDDEYYEGVNTGKLAFCAVCAVLLFAGSFAVRYFMTGTPLPTDAPPAAVTEEPRKEEIVIESDADLLAEIAQMKTRAQYGTLDVYYTGGEAYTETLASELCRNGDTLYIKDGDRLLACALSGETIGITPEAPSADAVLLGFTAYGDSFLAVFESEKENFVAVQSYDSRLELKETYKQEGRFSGIRYGDGAYTLITSVPPEVKREALPAYGLNGEEKNLTFERVYLPEGAVCSGFTVIGTVSGGETRVNAVLGGYAGSAVFDGDRLTITAADWNSTHIVKYRLIGTAAELISSEKISGEILSAGCYDDKNGRAVVYDSFNSCLNVIKKKEEGCASSAGFAQGESLSGVSFTDGRVYIVTKTEDGSAKLYCADTTGEIPEPTDAAPSAVYPEKLAAFGEGLIALFPEYGEDGERIGLSLTVYGYDNGLVPLRSAFISVDDKTSAEYARYLSGDAEDSPLKIAVSADGTQAAVSCVYFDGISEIERFICFRDSGAALEVTADHLLYDVRTRYRYLAFEGDKLYAVTDKGVFEIPFK